MFEHCDLHQGIYHVQSGFRNKTAIIDCPYLTQKIQVYDAPNLQILDGSTVYWREIRKFYVTKKHSNKQQLVINAAVVGLKHCQYFHDRINIICTLFQDKNKSSTLMAKPVNKKLPLLQIIQGSEKLPLDLLQNFCLNKTYQNVYFWVQIVGWEYNQKYPKAIVNDIFNYGKTAEGETSVILHELKIDQRVATLKTNKIQSIINYLPTNDHKEFTDLVFSIDPDNCVDMEDALSLKKIDHQVYEVGVHISDITPYLHLVDRQQICQRGCSIYLPHKTIPMFPKQITELCALKSKQKRLAFSVFFKIKENGNIIDTRFQKNIITNKAELTYKEAQDIIDEKPKIDKKLRKKHGLTSNEIKEIQYKMKVLKKIAFNRRKIRKNEEVLQLLDRNEITFELDESNMPVNIGIKKRLESEKLVEQFMIAANGQVAKKLTEDYGPNSLIIHHPKPSEYSISNLNALVTDFGVRFKADSIVSLESEMKKIFEKQGIKDEIKDMLVMKAIQIQELAVYTRELNSHKGHYGLNMKSYTHFTSPLRRFADVIVHEQLNTCLQKQKVPKYERRLELEIEVINKARARNKKLKQVVVESFLNLFLFTTKQKLSTKALIMSLGVHSATLYIPFYNIIKEVDWNTRVSYESKDTLKVDLGEKSKLLQKNDSIDILIEDSVNQEVKIKMQFFDEDGNRLQI